MCLCNEFFVCLFGIVNWNRKAETQTMVSQQWHTKADVMYYFFLRVKKLRRLESSFCAEAGNVCERDGPDASASACALMRDIHVFISVSSWACSRNSAPLSSLTQTEREKNKSESVRCLLKKLTIKFKNLHTKKQQPENVIFRLL